MMTDIETDLMLARAEIATLKADLAALTARAAKAEQERDRAIEDLTKLATKPITPCHSCSKTCLFPASLAPELQPPTWCREWRWRGLPQKGKPSEP